MQFTPFSLGSPGLTQDATGSDLISQDCQESFPPRVPSISPVRRERERERDRIFLLSLLGPTVINMKHVTCWGPYLMASQRKSYRGCGLCSLLERREERLRDVWLGVLQGLSIVKIHMIKKVHRKKEKKTEEEQDPDRWQGEQERDNDAAPCASFCPGEGCVTTPC